MRFKRPAFLAVLALLFAGCGEGGIRSNVTLSLSFVDNQPVPVMLPSGTGTVQAVTGTLRGSRFGIECTWVLNFSDGSNPTGTVSNCAIGPSTSLTVEVDLAGPPGPSGSHAYRFGLQ